MAAYQVQTKTIEASIPFSVAGVRKVLTNNGNDYVMVVPKVRGQEPTPIEGWTLTTRTYPRISITPTVGQSYTLVEDDLGNVYFNLSSFLP